MPMIPVHEYKTLMVPGDPCAEIPKQEYAGWEFVTMTAVVLSHRTVPGHSGVEHKMELLHTLLFRRPA